MYAHHCENCGGFVEDLADDNDSWDDIYEQIASQLLNNEDVKINADLHLKTARKLIDAIDKAALDSELGKPDPGLIMKLKSNIYPFSAAKSFQQMIYYRNMMHDKATGRIESKESFIKKIADTGEIFNKTHLAVEFDNAYYSTLMADKWERFSEDDLLEYSTVGDRNVRPSHALLDKFTAPKNHGFWVKNYPPNGWNCRCTVIPGKQQNITDKQQERFSAGMKQLKTENRETPFYNNVGESKLVFMNKHPYFNDFNTELSWKEYGLQSVEQLKLQPDNPELLKTTKEEYFDWWHKHRDKNDNIIIKDRFGDEILLKGGDSKNNFKNHIIHEYDKKKSENRFEYATEVLNIISDPDEVWHSTNKQSGGKTYIKYYENEAVKVIVSKDNIADSIYILDDKKYRGASGNARKGLLLYKK